MRCARFAYALILLLSSAALDDGWAATTPEATDDDLAALNNDYLCAAPHPRPKRPAGTDLPVPGAQGAAHASPPAGPARGPLVPARLPAGPDPSLLYLLMSLRR